VKKDRAYRTAVRIFGDGEYTLSSGVFNRVVRALRSETRRCIRASIRINPVLGGITDAVENIRKGSK